MTIAFQESDNVDDRHVNRPNAESQSMQQSRYEPADGSSDSIELGLPHEPLSITFFKTAFSITNLGLPGTPLFHFYVILRNLTLAFA